LQTKPTGSTRLTGMTVRLIYESGNGDVWALARDPTSDLPAVKHQPNASSGGQTSWTEIGGNDTVV
jgi:hypothetical protein